MSKNLVIVESPAKAKTIEKYLGKDYLVKSSYGHVRDLPKGNDAIDIAQGFLPHYEITPDKKQVVDELRKLAKKAETVWLATDDDREGEAISWHLQEALGLAQDTKRIVFHEITQKAILQAIARPRHIDLDLVNAQQARRVLDRLVGFELSPILWKKIKTGLSAGRVQSVAVRLVVEREREIDAHQASSAFRVTALFELPKGATLAAELPTRFKQERQALEFLQHCAQASFSILDLKTKPLRRSPAPPFTTSTLQQEASRKLGYSVSATMSLAQGLYEAGHITYMRTDSVNLSEDAQAAAAAQIQRVYGPDYVHTRQYKTKNKSAQEAHEAIRPTDFSQLSLPGVDAREQRLYELIWKRALASQMAEAELEKTTVQIAVSGSSQHFQASGEVVKFEGFLKAYAESTDEELEDLEAEELVQKGMLPPMQVGEALKVRRMGAQERFTRPAARYTEASLVKKLEELGIGRPSTYAPTISTIQKRGYAAKEVREGTPRDYITLNLQDGQVLREVRSELVGQEKNKLLPTNIGMVVNDFLVKYFAQYVDYSFTAQVEEQFDTIAHGNLRWQDMIREFYGSFHQSVEETTEKVDRSEVGGSRLIGQHPENGKPVVARLGRFGPIVQIGDAEGEEKPVFASLRTGQYIDTISMEDALELFKLPRTLGSFEDSEMVAGAGRFGPYVKHAGKFYSLPKGLSAETIDAPTAIDVIIKKREADANKILRQFEEAPDLQVLNGRWGPYIVYKQENYKLPKGTDVEAAKALTLEAVMEIVQNSTPSGGGKKKPAAKGKKAATEEAETKKPAVKTKKAAAPKAKAKKEEGAAEAKPKKRATKKSE